MAQQTQPPTSASHPDYPIQPPAKKRKKWPFVVGGIALLGLAGCIGMFTLIGKGAETLSDNNSGKNAAAGKMNTPATDGKFAFTVTGMKCGVNTVGPKSFGQKAQGEYCLVDVTVKNVAKSAETFDGSPQKAYDANGAEYSHDGSAAIWANNDSKTFLEQINPGNQVKGRLIFDVPKGTKLASVVLHESMFTAGVKVPLA